MNKTKRLLSKQKKAIKITLMADIHGNLSSDEKIKHLDRYSKIFTNLLSIK